MSHEPESSSPPPQGVNVSVARAADGRDALLAQMPDAVAPPAEARSRAEGDVLSVRPLSVAAHPMSRYG